jgi:tetratricopeptide (TPR) repeat protein
LLQEAACEEQGRGYITHGCYQFTHAKIRVVVYTEAGEARRSIFHRRALEMLQAAAAPAAELAYHALAAGLAEPAFQWSLAAGDEAMRVGAVRDAITFYEKAQHLLIEPSLETVLGAPAFEHLYAHLGQAYELNGEWEKARMAYISMLTFAREACQPEMERVALNHLATLTTC